MSIMSFIYKRLIVNMLYEIYPIPGTQNREPLIDEIYFLNTKPYKINNYISYLSLFFILIT